MRRLAALAMSAATALALVSIAQPATAQPRPALTNLAHLDALTTEVTPPAQAGHTTYRLGSDPSVGLLWVYANHNDDGTYTPTGGGTYHQDTNTYDQGAYDTDDIARAAVVYLRHWRQFGDAHSRTMAYQQLRGLTYAQTVSGPNAGNVVLWLQPDGTLNPSALPKEEPDPSDSANSYWLARTIWALGEGYAAFRSQDKGFATFLRHRMSLAVAALNRESLAQYGSYQRVDGVLQPRWLIVDDGGASAEAVLGLSAFVQAGGGFGQHALRRLAVGIAALGSAPTNSFPYGAILPSATSLSSWHAWASQLPEALASASVALHDRSLLTPAIADSSAFTPDLIANYGAINGLAPTPTDRNSIAYGVDSRVQSLLATARATGAAGPRDLAGVVAGWYFGQNPAGAPMYDPSTGVTYDGVSPEGVINRNSGAESTIHGLLSMLALDADPVVAAVAAAAGSMPVRHAASVVEGESATVSGAAAPAVPQTVSSAESTWSGGKYLAVRGTSGATWSVRPAGRPRLVEAVIDRVPGTAARGRFAGIGTLDFGGGAAQGTSAVPGRLVPVVVGVLPAGATTIRASFTGARGRLDALLLTPLISTMQAGAVTLLTSHAATQRTVAVTGRVVANSYDRTGRRVAHVVVTRSGATTQVPVTAGGFTIVRRAA